MDTAWIRVCYSIVLAVLLALAVAWGVAVALTGPTPPKPVGITFSQLNSLSSASDADSTRFEKSADSFFSDAQNYREQYPAYQRNVFALYAGLGILLAVIGVALPQIVNYLRLGFLLGGLLLVLAGTYLALREIPQPAAPSSGLLGLLSAGTPKVLDTAGRFLRFAVAVVGVLLLLFVGLWRLTDWGPAEPSRAASAPQPATVPATAHSAPPAPDAASAPPPTGEAVRWARPEDRPPAPAGGPPVEASALPATGTVPGPEPQL